MILRSYDKTSGKNTYNLQKDLIYTKEKILEILFIIGCEEKDLETITIDEIINKIRDLYPYVRVDNYREFNSEAELYLQEINILLAVRARRLWFKYQLIKNNNNTN